MRVVALLVLLCGCRVASGTPAMDATTPRGDGLAERITTDVALWADVRAADATGADRARDDAVGPDGAAADAADGASAPCRLLEASCPTRQACYPYPFEGAAPSGQTRCSFQGVGRPSVPCQSQVECDGETVCVTPGQPDAQCLQRCSLDGPNCPPGTACLPLAGYPGVGVCTL